MCFIENRSLVVKGCEDSQLLGFGLVKNGSLFQSKREPFHCNDKGGNGSFFYNGLSVTTLKKQIQESPF